MSFLTCALLFEMEESYRNKNNKYAFFPTSFITFTNTPCLRAKSSYEQIFLFITQENYTASDTNIMSKKLGPSHVSYLKEEDRGKFWFSI